MGNTYAWPIIRLVQRLSMALTLGCGIYVIFFLLSKNNDNSMSIESNDVSLKDAGLVQPAPVLDLKSNDAFLTAQERDIFSLPAAVNASGNVENTPKGQLPSHLKIVGILIADAPQVIIEDTLAKKTYFIDQSTPQAGIKIVRVEENQMIINYQGQDINVPINKNQ